MATAYQCKADGEYIGPIEINSGILPNGATWDVPPEPREGYILFHRPDGSWEYVEDHRKEEGYVDGVHTTINKIGPYPAGWSTVAPEPTEEERWESLRSMRDGRLAQCDWTQLADVHLTNAQKAAWVTYRQALRDLPSLEGAPWTMDTIPWPEAPAA